MPSLKNCLNGRVIAGICIVIVTPLCVAQEIESRVFPGTGAVTRRIPAPGRLDPADARFTRTLAPLTKEERNRVGKNHLPLIGIRRALSLDVQNGGGVRTLSNGMQVWQLTIHSPQAAAIRVHFSNFDVGAGQVWIYDGNAPSAASRRRSLGPWTNKGMFGSGEFWTGSVLSDTVTIEYAPATGTGLTAVAPFAVDAIAHFWQSLADNSTPVADADPSAKCELDVSCYSDYATFAKSTVAYDFVTDDGGGVACSGAIVGTQSASFLPYMLTANHCVSSESEAETVEGLFFYQTAKCGDTQPDLNSLEFDFGASYVTGEPISKGDYTLLLFQEPAPAGVTFAGWTINEPAVNDKTTCIHHPMESWTKITFGHRLHDDAVTVDGNTAPAADFYQIQSDKGVIEPGSSGSPLLNSKQQIVGTATASDVGSDNVCTLSQASVYGRFSNAWSGLKKYLEDTAASSLKVSANSLQWVSDNGKLISVPELTFTISTSSATAVPFSIIPSDSWVSISGSINSCIAQFTPCSVSAKSPLQVTVTVDPSAFSARTKATSAIHISSVGMKPVVVNASLDVRYHAVVAAAINPDPIYKTTPDASGNPWVYKVVLTESEGVPTQLTSFSIAGTDYTSQIASLFGGTEIPAHGTLTATIGEKNLVVPNLRTFQFAGADDVTGTTWSLSTTGLFEGTAAAPVTVFPHIAAGSEWQTDIVVANSGSVAAPFTLTFHADNGGPATLVSLGDMSQISDTVPAKSAKFYTINSMDGEGGWADLVSSLPLSGVATFRRHAADDNYYEGSVPLSQIGHGFAMPFDATAVTAGSPLLTGVAVMNADPNQQAQITCQAFDDTGKQLGGGPLAMPAIAPFSHTALLLQSTQPFQSAVANARGLLYCTSNTSIAAVGVRDLNYAISALPVTVLP